MTLENARFEAWAVVEVLGHHTYVGYVTEQTIAGSAFVRVDVPEADAVDATRYTEAQPVQPPFTKYVGTGSIYAITPVTEDFARAAANKLRARPHSVYVPELYPADASRQLAAGPDTRADEEDTGDYGEGELGQDSIANWEPRH